MKEQTTGCKQKTTQSGKQLKASSMKTTNYAKTTQYGKKTEFNSKKLNLKKNNWIQ